MKFQTHHTSTVPRIDHDLSGDKFHLFLLDFASGIIELPSSVGFKRILTFKKVSNGEGAIIISPPADQTINGSPSLSLTRPQQTVTLVATEYGWHILSAHPLNFEGDE